LTSLCILVGVGVNEVFLRVDILRRLAPTLNSPAVGLTHLGVDIVFLSLIGYFTSWCCGGRERSGTFRRTRMPEASANCGSRRPGKIEFLICPVSRRRQRMSIRYCSAEFATIDQHRF
jgi:hypothetical protein